MTTRGASTKKKNRVQKLFRGEAKVLSNHRRGKTYYLIIYTLLGISLLLLWNLSQLYLVQSEHLFFDDFTSFWVGAKLNREGGNPYSSSEVQYEINQLTGVESSPGKVLIPLTPPFTLSLLMPFGLPPYSASRLVWLMVGTGIVLWSANRTWRILAKDQRRIVSVYLLAFIVYPTIKELLKGQIAILSFLGIADFSYGISGNETKFKRASLMITSS
jgi:hypothetical protein